MDNQSPSVDPHDDQELSEGEYEVEAILNHRRRGKSRMLEYYISWKGYGSEEDTWEPEDSIMAPLLLEEYWREKGGPAAREAARTQKRSDRRRKSLKQTQKDTLTTTTLLDDEPEKKQNTTLTATKPPTLSRRNPNTPTIFPEHTGTTEGVSDLNTTHDNELETAAIGSKNDSRTPPRPSEVKENETKDKAEHTAQSTNQAVTRPSPGPRRSMAKPVVIPAPLEEPSTQHTVSTLKVSKRIGSPSVSTASHDKQLHGARTGPTASENMLHSGKETRHRDSMLNGKHNASFSMQNMSVDFDLNFDMDSDTDWDSDSYMDSDMDMNTEKGGEDADVDAAVDADAVTVDDAATVQANVNASAASGITDELVGLSESVASVTSAELVSSASTKGLESKQLESEAGKHKMAQSTTIKATETDEANDLAVGNTCGPDVNTNSSDPYVTPTTAIKRKLNSDHLDEQSDSRQIKRITPNIAAGSACIDLRDNDETRTDIRLIETTDLTPQSSQHDTLEEAALVSDDDLLIASHNRNDRTSTIKEADELFSSDVIFDSRYPSDLNINWEEKVDKIEFVTRDPRSQSEAQVYGVVRWDNGELSMHSTKLLRLKCPLKLIEFYENRLKFV